MKSNSRHPRNKRTSKKEDPIDRSLRPGAIANFMRPSKVEPTVYTVTQWVNYGAVSSSSTAPGYYAYKFLFSDLPDNANYATTYDFYRWLCAEVHVLPATQLSLPSNAPGYSFLAIANDYDDSTTPTSVNDIYSRASCAVIAPGQSHVRKIRPHVDIAVTSSAASSILGAANMGPVWLDCTSAGVGHYGIKIAITQSTSTNTNTWNVFVRHTIQLKIQR